MSRTRRAEGRSTIADLEASKLTLDLDAPRSAGYLLHSFCSPISNARTDQYGGSFENRVRLPLEITRKVREAWGDRPLFYRLSASDWADGAEKVGDEWKSWGIEQSVNLSRELQVRAPPSFPFRLGLDG